MSRFLKYKLFSELPNKDTLKSNVNILLGLEIRNSINEFQRGEFIHLIFGRIPGFGESSIEALIKRFKTMEAISRASIDQLSEVENIGPMKARIILDMIAFCKGQEPVHVNSDDSSILAQKSLVKRAKFLNEMKLRR